MILDHKEYKFIIMHTTFEIISELNVISLLICFHETKRFYISYSALTFDIGTIIDDFRYDYKLILTTLSVKYVKNRLISTFFLYIYLFMSNKVIRKMITFIVIYTV